MTAFQMQNDIQVMIFVISFCVTVWAATGPGVRIPFVVVQWVYGSVIFVYLPVIPCDIKVKLNVSKLCISFLINLYLINYYYWIDHRITVFLKHVWFYDL